MNIWIVQASSGQYDDYNTWNVKAFTSKEKADKWVEKNRAKVEVDVLAQNYLRKLEYKYFDEVYHATKNATLTDEEIDNLYEMSQDKAYKETQEKYPEADLTIDEDFNGYFVSEQSVELVE